MPCYPVFWACFSSSVNQTLQPGPRCAYQKSSMKINLSPPGNFGFNKSVFSRGNSFAQRLKIYSRCRPGSLRSPSPTRLLSTLCCPSDQHWLQPKKDSMIFLFSLQAYFFNTFLGGLDKNILKHPNKDKLILNLLLFVDTFKGSHRLPRK